MSQREDARLPLWADTLGYMSPTPMVFSASRIGTWIACNRKAAWQYFAGYTPPPTNATDKGGAVHGVLEKAVPALARGLACEIDRTTEVGAIAAEIVPHIPQAMLGPETEYEGRRDINEPPKPFTIRGRHEWMGYKDLRVPGIVVDYKTTSDFKYMKSATELETDPQAALYAWSEFIDAEARGLRFDSVWLRWIYSRTRGAKKAEPVDLGVTKKHAGDMFLVLESFADEMQAAADACPPRNDPVALQKYILASVRGNEDRCDDYGGCPHKARCGIFFQDPNRPKDTYHMSLLERLQAMTALNGGPANEPPTVPALPTPPTPALLPTGPAPSDLMARLSGQKSPEPTPPQAEVDAVVAGAEGINPPKRKPGRPKKDTIPAPAPVDPPSTKETVAVALAEGAKNATLPGPASSPVAPEKHIETLCVGCMPFGHAFESLDTLLAEARDMLGPATYFGGYGYKTNGMMIEALQKILSARGSIDVLVVPDPRLPEAALVLSHLRAMAQMVVEALR